MKNLKEIVEERRLTVKELAAKSKLPPKTIKQLMDRSRIANIEEILRLADALELSVIDLGKILVQDERFEKFRKRSNRGFSYKKFEEQLRKKQLNPTRLSELTGIHFSTILRWKNLNNQPSKENIQLIADILGCSTNDLCENPEENEGPKAIGSKSLSKAQKTKVKAFDSDALLHFIAVHRLSTKKISQLSGIAYNQLCNLKMGLQIRRFELDRLCNCLNVDENIFAEKNELTASARKCQTKYDPKIFSKAFLFLIEKYSMSQYSLSVLLDVSCGTIKPWFLGNGVPIIEQTILLSEFFGVMPDFFLTDPEGSTPDFIKENHLFENESEPLFAKRLRQILQEKKLTQAELVRRARTDLINVDISAMAQYCSGHRFPRKQLIQQFAEILEVDPKWLMGESAFNPIAFKQKILLSELSIAKIARNAGISVGKIHYWCRSAQHPDKNELAQIACTLGCTVEDFYKETLDDAFMGCQKFDFKVFKQCVKDSGYSITTLSAESKIPITTIYTWLSGRCKPTLKSLKKVAAVLGCDANDFYSSESENLQNKPTQVEKERKINTMSNKESKIQTSEYTVEKLRHAMKKGGFTIKSLAEQLDMSTSTVSHWTCGDRVPSPQAMSKLFEILDFSIDDSETETSRFNNETFKQHLEASGLSMYEISKKSGVNRSTIYNWCCGRAKNPAMKHLKPVASLLNCPIDVFYDPITPESESQPIKVKEVPSCESTILPQSPADSPSFILSEEDLEPGIVQARLSIMENERIMTFRTLLSELQESNITIPEFAYEVGFSKSEMENWKKTPKKLSESQIKTISEFLNIVPNSLPTTSHELELDKMIQKFINDLPEWSYKDLEKLLSFIHSEFKVLA